MLRSLLIFFLFKTSCGFGQLYFGDVNYVYYYVDLKKDSATIEMFKDNLNSIEKRGFERLGKGNGNILFSNTSSKVVEQKGKYYLLRQEKGRKKLNKIKLNLCETDVREGLRMEAHYCAKKDQLEHLEDSLAGLSGRSSYSLERSVDWSASEAYIAYLDQTFDSLSKKISKKADPNAVRTYAIMDSIKLKEPKELFDHLKKAKFEFYYGQTLIFQLGVHRPEILISYLSKNPDKKPEVLKVIRDHKYFREIIAGVHAWPEKSPIKPEIEKQKRKRVWRDARAKTGLKVLIGVEVAVILGVILFFATK